LTEEEKMTEKKTVLIEGKTIFGETRKYKFTLLDAKTGLEIFHEYASILITGSQEIIPALTRAINSEIDGGVDDLMSVITKSKSLELIRLVPSILTMDRIQHLAKTMLTDCEVTVDNEVQTIDGDGLAPYMIGDPLELYTAIFYAVCANYPKYVAPFLGALEENQGETDTSQTIPASQA
jgi:hypothetical protein